MSIHMYDDIIETLKRGVLVFNGLNMDFRYGNELMTYFNKNKNAEYVYKEFDKYYTPHLHKTTWEEIRNAIDYINSGKHDEYYHAEMWLEYVNDEGTRGIVILLQSRYCNNPEEFDTKIYMDKEKRTWVDRHISLARYGDDYKTHVSLDPNDIRSFKFY